MTRLYSRDLHSLRIAGSTRMGLVMETLSVVVLSGHAFLSDWGAGSLEQIGWQLHKGKAVLIGPEKRPVGGLDPALRQL